MKNVGCNISTAASESKILHMWEGNKLHRSAECEGREKQREKSPHI